MRGLHQGQAAPATSPKERISFKTEARGRPLRCVWADSDSLTRRLLLYHYIHRRLYTPCKGVHDFAKRRDDSQGCICRIQGYCRRGNGISNTEDKNRQWERIPRSIQGILKRTSHPASNNGGLHSTDERSCRANESHALRDGKADAGSTRHSLLFLGRSD